MRSLELAPGLAERIRGGTRSEPFRGTKQLPNHRRRASGDAGRWSETPATTRIRSLPSASATPSATPSCWPVPCTAGSRAASRSPTPLRDTRSARNALSAAGFESTVQFARLEPPSPEQQQLFGALLRDQEQTDRFFGTFAGSVSAEEFFAPENLARIMGGAAADRPLDGVR